MIYAPQSVLPTALLVRSHNDEYNLKKVLPNKNKNKEIGFEFQTCAYKKTSKREGRSCCCSTNFFILFYFSHPSSFYSLCSPFLCSAPGGSRGSRALDVHNWTPGVVSVHDEASLFSITGALYIHVTTATWPLKPLHCSRQLSRVQRRVLNMFLFFAYVLAPIAIIIIIWIIGSLLLKPRSLQSTEIIVYVEVYVIHSYYTCERGFFQCLYNQNVNFFYLAVWLRIMFLSHFVVGANRRTASL